MHAGLPRETVSGREVYYKMRVSIDYLLEKHGCEILDWARRATGDEKLDTAKLMEILENKKREIRSTIDQRL